MLSGSSGWFSRKKALRPRLRPAPCGAKPSRVLVVPVLQHQHGLGHVERNEGTPVIVRREAGPVRGRTLAVIEQAIRLLKDEVVLVPEAIGDRVPESCGGKIMDRDMVGLGPRPHHLQGLPIGPAVVARRLDPGIVTRDFWRVDRCMPAGCGHATLVDLRAEPREP